LNDSSPEKVSKLNMDILLLDLEDSVPIQEKENARMILNKYFLSIKENVPQIALRINSLKSLDGIKDLKFISDHKLFFNVILLSMVEYKFEVLMARQILKESDINSRLFVLIETPLAVKNVESIASVSDGLLFGGADYCSQIGTKISKKNIQIDYVSSRIVNAAKMFNIPAYDTPCFKMEDLDYLKNECELGFTQGFVGKQAIHPQQLEIINHCFQYKTRDVEWAENVVKSAEGIGGRIIKSSSNVMIGPPFVKLAKKILETSVND
jgi:citrate lyase subunit beta/citryl-CoA lyase/(S)-citramalyl-CoA lyase